VIDRQHVSLSLSSIPTHQSDDNTTIHNIMLRLLTLLSLAFGASAWTTSSAVSSFGGSVLITDRPTVSFSSMEMKKGKPNVPPQMRGQYMKQQERQAMREQMVAASKPGADGLPVFNLFVRTKKGNVSSGVVS